MWIKKKTQYGGDVVMFLPNKIIKDKNSNYPKKNVGLAHGFKTMSCAWFDMVLKPCHVHGFKTMCKAF